MAAMMATVNDFWLCLVRHDRLDAAAQPDHHGEERPAATARVEAARPNSV
jgi:hypothetical protein